MLNIACAGDNSDITVNVKLQYNAALNNADTKEKVWKLLIDPKSSYSLLAKRNIIDGFYSINQLDLIRPYFDRFYDVLPMFENGGYSQKYTQVFF